MSTCVGVEAVLDLLTPNNPPFTCLRHSLTIGCVIIKLILQFGCPLDCAYIDSFVERVVRVSIHQYEGGGDLVIGP